MDDSVNVPAPCFTTCPAPVMALVNAIASELIKNSAAFEATETADVALPRFAFALIRNSPPLMVVAPV